MLDIENLSYHYRKGDHSLNDVSLHLDKGKLAVLLGKNGSGKSTLMKCLLSLNKGYEGEILLDGKNIKEIKNKEAALSGGADFLRGIYGGFYRGEWRIFKKSV